MISIRERTYKDLAELGNLEDTFDLVIQRLLELSKEKVREKKIDNK
jgi:predicted CopG family antitoxin